MRLLRFSLAFLLLLPLRSMAQQMITPDQAILMVQAFEGDSTMQFNQVQLMTSNLGPPWSCADYYVVKHTEDASNHSWDVDAFTGEVLQTYYGDRYPSQGSSEPIGPLAQAECLQIAENFARSKYGGFDSMGFHLRDQAWSRTGWGFLWQQKLAYDAATPNVVTVEVNPLDGAVQHYSASRIAILDPQQPTVTAEQSVQLALSATGIVTLNSTEGPFLVADPDRTYWQLEVDGLDATSEHLNYLVEVDAYSGEVTGTYPAFLPPGVGKTAKPVEGGPISVRDLTANVPGARVHWLGKEARLFVGRNRYTLVPGKNTIEWTGGTIKLSQKMKLVNGRLMVPSGLLDVLKSAPAPKKAPPIPAKSK